MSLPATALVLDVDTMLGAAEQLAELNTALAILARHRVRIDATPIENRIAWLLDAPVDVLCYLCARRTVTVIGIARGTDRPLCERCLTAACDVPGCYVPAAVGVVSERRRQALCERHGLAALADTHGPARLHHFPDGATRRAKFYGEIAS